MLLNHIRAGLVYPAAERLDKRDVRAKVRWLRRYYGTPWPQRKKEFAARLAEVVAHAGATVPYYRDLFQERGFDPEKLRDDPARLADLPVLTKEAIREAGPRLRSETEPQGRLHECKTGASTGPAAVIFYDQAAADWSAATNLIALEWAGKFRHHREAHLSSRFPEVFPFRDRMREWVKCQAMNRVNIVTDAFDPEALDLFWRRLRRARPMLVQGHPSTLYALALHLRERGLDGRGVFSVFESTGEVLAPHKRELIAEVFRCRVYDRYGAAEFGVVAHQLEPAAGAPLKIMDALVWAESVPVGEGEPQIVLTGLRNDAMPLIRYQVGDLGAVLEGEDGVYLDSVGGRMHDVVAIGEAVFPTHYVQDLLARIGGIDDFQIFSGGASRPVLRLVVPDPGHREAVRRRLAGWWGDNMTVEFVAMEELVRQGRLGKFRYLVNAPPGGEPATHPRG